MIGFATRDRESGKHRTRHAITGCPDRARLGRASRRLSYSRRRAHPRRSARLLQATWPRRTTKTSTSPPGFLPKALRPHFHSIYAYCRISDDLGDEVADPAQALALLDLWGRELDACYEGRARHPVFVALAETIRACSIPKEPFADLLIAFRQDQTVTRYETMRGCACLLPLLGQSCRPAGALCVRRSETRKTSGSPTLPAPRCNWPTSGRMCAWISPRAACICRRRICGASA